MNNTIKKNEQKTSINSAQKGQYMKMCSTFLIREMKIKTTIKGHYTPIIMAKTKKD